MYRSLLVTISIVGLSLVPVVGGCSSSSGGGSGNNSDSGSSSGGSSSGGSSGGSSSGGSSGSSSGGSSSGGSSGSSSGGGSGSSSGGDGGNGGDGGSCSPGAVTAKDVPAYAAPSQQINACSPTQIAAYVKACDSSTFDANACNTFQSTKANAGCITCLFGVNDAGMAGETGAQLIDAAMMTIVGDNLPGCLALEDKANGPACGAVLEPAIQCQSFACSSCMDSASFQSCAQAANGTGGVCNQYASKVQAACKADFADSGAANTKCATATEIINIICGTGK